MAIIVVEGIDRVGKTTLCNKLNSLTGFTVFKHDNIFNDVYDFPYHKMDNVNETDKMMQLVELAVSTCSDVIFDRFHMSDFVYGVLCRQYDKGVAWKSEKLLDSLLAFNKAILCCVHPTDIVRSESEHGSSLVVHDMLFESLFDKTAMRRVDTDYDNLDNAAKEVAQMLIDDDLSKLHDVKAKFS